MSKRLSVLLLRCRAILTLFVVSLLALSFLPSLSEPQQLGRSALVVLPKEDEETPRPDHPGEAVTFRKLQLQDENGFIPQDGLTKAAQHLKLMRSTQKQRSLSQAIPTQSDWTWLGPGNIGGRTRSILIHPTKPATMWLGSVSGGVWRTTDGGASWLPLDDFMANLAVSALAMDPTNPDIIYAGTGEGFYNEDAIRGAGIFKTTDGGITWQQLPATNGENWYFVNRLAIDPNNGQVILAATNSGIYRSTDGGSNWTRVQYTRMLDIKFHPSDSSLAVAGGGSGEVLFSTDGGINWNYASANLGSGSRIELAYARSKPSIVYASVSRNDGDVCKTINGATTSPAWIRVDTNSPSLPNRYVTRITFDPNDANKVCVTFGGFKADNVWRTTDGGANWQVVAGSGDTSLPTVPVHSLAIHPKNPKLLFVGTELGLLSSRDGGVT